MHPINLGNVNVKLIITFFVKKRILIGVEDNDAVTSLGRNKTKVKKKEKNTYHLYSLISTYSVEPGC